MSALSAVEMALWDILGKSLNVPVYQLMGGKVNDKVRIYVNLSLIHISEPTRQAEISYAVFCLKKKKKIEERKKKK